MTKVRIGHTI